MEEKLVTILNEMAEYLSIAQMKKLQEVLLKNLAENEPQKAEISNAEYLQMFLDAKKIEGCSERTLQYYRVTVERMLQSTTTPIRKICTEEIRSYLSGYQQINGCGKVTVDNIRRNISSFFSWLEEEDYILKSPMRRIHKIKTKQQVKETISDEAIEQLRDHCACARDLAMIDLLYSTGIRVGELVNLNIDDVNFEARECVVFGKGDKERRVYFDAKAKLHLQNYDIQPIISDGTSNNTVLLKFLHSLRDNVQSNQVIIGMFDRDTPLLTEINGSRVDIRNEKFVKIGKNIFAFSIPVPHARAESNQISIEHYFTDEEIKTELEGKRLFIGNEFYKTGVCKSNPSLYYKSGARVADTIKIIEHESNNYVMNADGTGDYSISKSAFVNAICEEKDSFKGFSFDEFQKIFDVINSIVSSSKE